MELKQSNQTNKSIDAPGKSIGNDGYAASGVIIPGASLFLKDWKMAKTELDSPYHDVTVSLETFGSESAHLGATGNSNKVRMVVEIVLESLSGEWEPDPDASTQGRVRHSGQDAGIYLRKV